MSGSIEIGTCGICKETDIPLSRKYFQYDIKCECHSSSHFEIVRHCSKCTPVEPIFTVIQIKTENLVKR